MGKDYGIMGISNLGFALLPDTMSDDQLYFIFLMVFIWFRMIDHYLCHWSIELKLIYISLT